MIVTMFGTHILTKGEQAGDIVPGFKPYRAETTWSEFTAMLREAAQIITDPSEKIRTFSLSMAEFEAGKNRGNNFAIGCDFVGVDLDNKGGDDPDQWTIATLVPWLDAQDLTYVIYTTASSRVEAECLRLLLPLSSRVAADEWTIFWNGCNIWLRGKMDPQTKDVARLFFEPRHWIGAPNHFIATEERLPLNVDAMFANASAMPAPAMRSTADRAIAKAAASIPREIEGDCACLDTSPIIPGNAVEDALAAPKGGRLFKFLCRCAAYAVRENIEINQWDMERLAYNMAIALNRRTTGLERDAERALDWARNAVITAEAERLIQLRRAMRGR